MTRTRIRHAPAVRGTGRRVPRPQAERVEAMRTRLLAATIECLSEFGYSAMSTNDVVRRAHVSRGALAHHFPTKADLVTAAAARLVEQRGAEFRERFGAMAPQQRTPAEALSVLWSMYDDENAAALIELSVAARHRPELRAVLAVVPDRIAELTRDIMAEFFPELAGLPFVEECLYAVHAMYEGLALNAMAGEDLRRRGEELRALLRVAVSFLPQLAQLAGRPQ